MYCFWKFRNYGQNTVLPLEGKRVSSHWCGTSGEYTTTKPPQEGDTILSSLSLICYSKANDATIIMIQMVII